MGHSHGPGREVEATDYSSPQAHFDVIILEAGIIFHSYVANSLQSGCARDCADRQADSRIMIGVSLGASGGDQWIPLFIAIVFHQLFEGLALGSRIGQLVWPKHQWWKKWAMSLLFGVSSDVSLHPLCLSRTRTDPPIPLVHHSPGNCHRNGSSRLVQPKFGSCSPFNRSSGQYISWNPHLRRPRRVSLSRRRSSNIAFEVER